jgi:hypothetical protein
MAFILFAITKYIIIGIGVVNRLHVDENIGVGDFFSNLDFYGFGNFMGFAKRDILGKKKMEGDKPF